MSDRYGEHLVNDAKRGEEKILEGTWEYNGDTHNLQVKNISQPDLNLIRQYASVAGQFQHLAETGDDLSEEHISRLEEQTEELDNFSWEDNGEREFIPSIIDEKLVNPDVDVEATSEPVIQALITGMMETWSESADVREAREEMPIEGNP